MNFFDRLLRAFRKTYTDYYYDFLADTEEGWTNEDSLRLAQFYDSATGRKLKIRLTNYCLRTAMASVRAGSNLELHCGIARGVQMAVEAIEQHFAIPPTNEVPDEEQKQEEKPLVGAAADLALN